MFVCLTSPNKSRTITRFFSDHSKFVEWLDANPGWTWSNCDEPFADIDDDDEL